MPWQSSVRRNAPTGGLICYPTGYPEGKTLAFLAQNAPKPMMHGHEKSRLRHSSCEAGEQSGAIRRGASGAKGGDQGEQSTRRTQSRTSVSKALARIRQIVAVDTRGGSAVCGKAARTDLSGGREATRVPTATHISLRCISLLMTHSVALNPFCQGLLIEGEADTNAAAR